MKEAILAALSTVSDPDLGSDLVTLGMIKDIDLESQPVKITVELTTPACPMKQKIEDDCKQALSSIEGLQFEIILTAKVLTNVKKGSSNLSEVKNIVLVLSGKGGVGKSTVATNIALCLSRGGSKVGLLDADIYGPSIPTMMGSQDKPTLSDDQKIIPLESHGIKIMSSGFLVDEDSALIWRGPMIHKIVNQFCTDVDWGPLDYLVLDLPPGTGDVQLSLSQVIPVVGAVMVTTPQQVALADVRRAESMLRTLKIPLLGIIENMSGYTHPESGEIIHFFAEGGGKKLAEKTESRLLGSIPLDPEVCKAGDNGVPVVISNSQSAAAEAFEKASQNLAAQISIFNHKGISSKVIVPKRPTN
ncbi:MAG: hypothetical protein CL521_03080 [Actinobacteria bacterium]|nr:hypothetical protein [Actinomycetota bacterium]